MPTTKSDDVKCVVNTWNVTVSKNRCQVFFDSLFDFCENRFRFHAKKVKNRLELDRWALFKTCTQKFVRSVVVQVENGSGRKNGYTHTHKEWTAVTMTTVGCK